MNNEERTKLKAELDAINYIQSGTGKHCVPGSAYDKWFNASFKSNNQLSVNQLQQRKAAILDEINKS